MSSSTSKSLFRCINGLRYCGVGSKVTRDIYKFTETYWIITRVKLSKDQNHGKVYGRLVWRGKAKPNDTRITTALKPQWSLLGVPDYFSFKGRPAEVEKIFAANTERLV